LKPIVRQSRSVRLHRHSSCFHNLVQRVGLASGAGDSRSTFKELALMRRVPFAILTASLALFIGTQRAQSQSSSQSSSGSKQGSAASPQDQSGRTGTTDTQRSAEQTRTNDIQRTGQDTATDRGQGTRTDDRSGGFDRNQPMDRDRARWNYGDRSGIGSN